MAAPATTTEKSKNWVVQILTSSIGRKVLMASTGLFLILFLVVHLLGNLQLLKGMGISFGSFVLSEPDKGAAFNYYANFMGHNPIIQTISWGNLGFIVLHIIVAFWLNGKNRSARPVGYAYYEQSKSSTWSSRNMLLLGSVVLIFLALHLVQFWGRSKWGHLPEITYEGDIRPIHNLYFATVEAFKEWYYVAIYVVGMFGLGYHLLHGFWSAFQTLGLQHSKYTPLINFVGTAYAIVVPLLYALIPIYMFGKSQSWF